MKRIILLILLNITITISWAADDCKTITNYSEKLACYHTQQIIEAEIINILSGNSENLSLEIEDSEGSTALQWAAYINYPEKLLELIALGADINHQAHLGDSALHWAALNGDNEIIKILIAHNATIDISDKNGATPLHWAVSAGQIEAMQLLLTAGANINQQDIYGDSILHWAIGNQQLAALDFLLEHQVKLETKNIRQETPLHWIAEKGNIELMKRLLKAGSDIHATTVNGETALHIATIFGNLEKVKLLVTAGSAINVKEKTYQASAINFAAYNNYQDILEYLIQQGAEIHHLDNSNQTLLHWALLNPEISPPTSLVKILLDKNIDIHQIDKYNNTILYQAVSKGYIEIVQLLLAKNADTTVLGEHGHSILHQALDQPEMLLTLLESGVDPALTDTSGNTALIHAIYRYNYQPELFELLLPYGAINQANDQGNTPLHEAVKLKQPSIVAKLLAYGAKTDIKNKVDKSAIDIAQSSKDKEIIQLFIQYNFIQEDQETYNNTWQKKSNTLSSSLSFHKVLVASNDHKISFGAAFEEDEEGDLVVMPSQVNTPTAPATQNQFSLLFEKNKDTIVNQDLVKQALEKFIHHVKASNTKISDITFITYQNNQLSKQRIATANAYLIDIFGSQMPTPTIQRHTKDNPAKNVKTIKCNSYSYQIFKVLCKQNQKIDIIISSHSKAKKPSLGITSKEPNNKESRDNEFKNKEFRDKNIAEPKDKPKDKDESKDKDKPKDKSAFKKKEIYTTVLFLPQEKDILNKEQVKKSLQVLKRKKINIVKIELSIYQDKKSQLSRQRIANTKAFLMNLLKVEKKILHIKEKTKSDYGTECKDYDYQQFKMLCKRNQKIDIKIIIKVKEKAKTAFEENERGDLTIMPAY